MLKTQLIGHIGKDCTVNDVNGKSVINFSVAHSEKYKDTQGVQHDKTVWVDCARWTDSLAIANYLKKGTMVYVEGTPGINSFIRQDGSAGHSLTLRVNQIQLLGSGQQTKQATKSQHSQPEVGQYWGDNNKDDLPF